jgi:hypothetical protein
MHMNAQFVQNGAFFVKDGIEYQIYYDADGILSFHRIEFYDSNSIDGEQADQLRQNAEEAERRTEEAERRAEEAERRAEEAERRAEEAEQQVQTLQQVVQHLTKFVEEGEEEKKTTEAPVTETPSTETPSSSWSKPLFSTSEKEEEKEEKKEEKEEKKEEKEKPKIVVREDVDLETDNEYSDDFVGILREILLQLQGWLVDLNGSEDTEMCPMINLEKEYKWFAKILGVSPTNFDVSINGTPYEIYSYNRKEDSYRVMIPFLNTVLRKIGVGCFVSSYDFRFLKLKITNQEKFEQNLSSIGDYLYEGNANILALIKKNSRN